MALEQLAAIQGSQVLEFNPWQWAGQDKLSSSFFEEIFRVVQRKNPTEADKQLAKVLRRYERRLNAGAGVLSVTAKWAPILLGSALVTTALGSVAEGTAAQVTIWTVSAVSWLGSLAPWLKQGAEWCTKRSKNLDQQANDSELTLSQIRAELQKLLSARQKPF